MSLASSSPVVVVDATPNTQLTLPEKVVKRNLKRHLKQRIRIRKYEMRWLQSCTRRDEAIQNRAVQELKDYLRVLQSEPDSLWFQPEFLQHEAAAYREFLEDPRATIIPIQQDVAEPPSVSNARVWITKEIWQKLVKRMLPESVPTSSSSSPPLRQDGSKNGLARMDGWNDSMQPANKHPSGRSHKLTQTLQARPLLSHMTKGTQTESMFENDAALIGYTRQKFMERAVLVFKSFEKLRDSPLLWEQLIRVRSVLSVGCGPGCDAVGVVTFLRHVLVMGEGEQPARREEGEGNLPIVDRVLLMDFVMPRWNRLVIKHLDSIIRPRLVSTVETAACDVRYSFHDERNSQAAECIVKHPIDLVVISYLLTETRDQWTDFFRDLLESLTTSCLFLLSEPTAWQLHSFANHFADFVVEQEWVDSSQHMPELQPLEGRMGPAVLVLHVRPKP